MTTISVTERLYAQTCINCGVLFGIPESMDNRLRESRRAFYCPNGHRQLYVGKTEAEKLRQQLAAKDREIAAARSRAETERNWRLEEQTKHEHTRRRLNGTRGVVSRMKRRLVAGSCPCCSKKFKDLERHMKGQHPNFDPDKAAEALAEKATA